jgi:hypothetical protein
VQWFWLVSDFQYLHRFFQNISTEENGEKKMRKQSAEEKMGVERMNSGDKSNSSKRKSILCSCRCVMVRNERDGQTTRLRVLMAQKDVLALGNATQ